MNDIDTDDVSAPGLVERLKTLFLKPAQTWPVIAAEPATPGDLFRRYAVPLAAIGPLGTFLHGQLFGYEAFGFSYTPGLVAGLTGMIVTYVTALVGVGILAVVADWLAPKFGGTANRANAFKLVIFGSTAAWLAGIFQLVPGLGVLGLAGLYSLYLYYAGAPSLMKVPQDKTLAFTAVTILCAIGLYMVVGAVGTRFTAMAGGSKDAGTIAAAADDGHAEISIPGIGKLDTAKIGAATRQLEAATNAEAMPVSGAQLKTLLPAAIGSYQRSAIETNALGQMGTQVDGTYVAGKRTFHLKVVDSAGLGALAGIGSAMGVEQSKQDANGYEKTTSAGGQFQNEKWSKTDNRGSFSQQVGGRFIVTADGEAASIDELRAAVAGIDPSKLAAIAR